ncbi:MAG TPA: ATPase [Firmicutes bacterium]|nr:ATPase [Bacillota bacterium]
MSFVLGVDGGGTKTYAVVADENGTILSLGKGGPSNHQSIGVEKATEEIAKAIQEALDGARLRSDDIAVGFLALAGADFPEDYEILTQGLQRFSIAQKIILKNDTIGAFLAGTKLGYGAVVICGTGTNAAGVYRDGRTFQLGGIGYMSGDWGGAVSIVPEMIRLAFRSWDGRYGPSMIPERILKSLGLSTMDEFMMQLYHDSIDRHKLLSLCPIVFEAAYEGDPIGIEIVERQGEEVGLTAVAILRRLGLDREEADVVLNGSIFNAIGPLLIDTITHVVHRKAPLAKIRRAEFHPVIGSIFGALRAIGISVSDSIRQKVRETMPEVLIMPEIRP